MNEQLCHEFIESLNEYYSCDADITYREHPPSSSIVCSYVLDGDSSTLIVRYKTKEQFVYDAIQKFKETYRYS